VRPELENRLEVSSFRVGEVRMLTLEAPQAETLWDEVLPIEARVLPEDQAKLDRPGVRSRAPAPDRRAMCD
jgi:hypothetical protein